MNRSMRRIRCWAAALALAGFTSQMHAGPDNTAPKEVLVFYYGWYDNPQTKWGPVDPASGHVGNTAHSPRLGTYSSHDPKIMEQHFAWAKKAGITGFIWSYAWWKTEDNASLPRMLDLAQKSGMHMTVYYEGIPHNQAGEAAKDIAGLLERYAKHPAWLKVRGKPVLFVYGRAVNQIKLDGWKEVIAAVNAKYPGGAFFVGDGISERNAKVFDAVHTYNITARTAGMTVDTIRHWAKKMYARAVTISGDRVSCLTIIPGYDDTRATPARPAPRPTTDRHDGATYRVLWEEAIAARPNWVLITSWNEWFEGSEIEPSTECGDTALKTTGEFSRKFLGDSHKN